MVGNSVSGSTKEIVSDCALIPLALMAAVSAGFTALRGQGRIRRAWALFAAALITLQVLVAALVAAP